MPSSDQSTIDHSLFTAAFPNQFLCAPKQGEGCGEQRMEETEFREDIPDSNSTIFSPISPCSASLPHLSWVTSTYHYPLPSVPIHCLPSSSGSHYSSVLNALPSPLCSGKQGTPSGTTGQPRYLFSGLQSSLAPPFSDLPAHWGSDPSCH